MQRTDVTPASASVILRIGAFLIDTVLTSLVSLTIVSVFGNTESLSRADGLDQNTVTVVIIVNAIYTIGFNATMSATFGKIALGMYVADLKGARIRPDTAILRYIAFLVGHAFFFGTLISFILMLVHPSRRTLHDRIAGTTVLRRPRDTELPPPDLS